VADPRRWWTVYEIAAYPAEAPGAGPHRGATERTNDRRVRLRRQKAAARLLRSRHLVTLGQLPDGKYQWEERPGLPPIGEESQNRLIVEFVRAERDPENVTVQE
jgi:hypothetical protein